MPSASRRARADVQREAARRRAGAGARTRLRDFASFLLLEQLGPRTLQSLALVAEVVHGAPTRFDDPARFSFAHGGKDGHPFPVPLKVYDESIAVLRRALDAAKLGHTDKLDGFARLDAFTRAIEQRRWSRGRRRRHDRPRARDLAVARRPHGRDDVRSALRNAQPTDLSETSGLARSTTAVTLTLARMMHGFLRMRAVSLALFTLALAACSTVEATNPSSVAVEMRNADPHVTPDIALHTAIFAASSSPPARDRHPSRRSAQLQRHGGHGRGGGRSGLAERDHGAHAGRGPLEREQSMRISIDDQGRLRQQGVAAERDRRCRST